MEQDTNIAIGADIGGGHIVCAAVDMTSGKLIADTTTSAKVNSKGTSDEILACWTECLNTTIDKIDPLKLKGIGFAIPGPFNYQTGVAVYEKTDKYENLYNVSIKEALPPLLKQGAEVRFVNDASAFAVGVAWFGKARHTQRSMSITLGTGFGSAFIDDGIPVVERDDVPEQGCLWHLPFKEGIADDYFSTRWFVKRCSQVTGQSVKGVKELAQMAPGNKAVNDIFLEFADNLAGFLMPWLKAFKPEMLVMGGNIMGAADLFLPALRKSVSDHTSVVIEISELMEEAAMIGSARLLDDHYWKKIQPYLPTI